jgi:hypothetical protein
VLGLERQDIYVEDEGTESDDDSIWLSATIPATFHGFKSTSHSILTSPSSRAALSSWAALLSHRTFFIIIA